MTTPPIISVNRPVLETSANDLANITQRLHDEFPLFRPLRSETFHVTIGNRLITPGHHTYFDRLVDFVTSPSAEADLNAPLEDPRYYRTRGMGSAVCLLITDAILEQEAAAVRKITYSKQRIKPGSTVKELHVTLGHILPELITTDFINTLIFAKKERPEVITLGAMSLNVNDESCKNELQYKINNARRKKLPLKKGHAFTPSPVHHFKPGGIPKAFLDSLRKDPPT